MTDRYRFNLWFELAGTFAFFVFVANVFVQMLGLRKSQRHE